MNQIEKNKSKTDQAWAQLYTRLEQDGLLDSQFPVHKSHTGSDL